MLLSLLVLTTRAETAEALTSTSGTLLIGLDIILAIGASQVVPSVFLRRARTTIGNTDIVEPVQALVPSFQPQHSRNEFEERRFRALMEDLSEGLMLTAADLTIRFAGASTKRLLGYEPEELVGRNLAAWLHPSDLDEQRSQFAALLAKPGGRATGLCRIRHQDGSWRSIATVRVNLLADPAVHAIVNTYRDITPRIESEEALRRRCDALESSVRQRTIERARIHDALQAEAASHARTEAALRRLNVTLENEDKRIASVLHDEAGTLLTVAHISLADVARDLPPASRERLVGVRKMFHEIEAQLRRLSHELHPRVLEDLGLIGGLEFLAGSVTRRTGIPIDLDLVLDGRLDPVIEAAIYRVVQEALTNIARHSRALRASVELRRDGRTLAGSIRDNGVGFDVLGAASRRGEGGLGLRGIKDRLEAVRGRLEIVSEPGVGTDVRVTIPLEENDGVADCPG